MVSIHKPLLSPAVVTRKQSLAVSWLIAMTKAFLLLFGISQPTPEQERSTALGLCASIIALAAITAAAALAIVRFVAQARI